MEVAIVLQGPFSLEYTPRIIARLRDSNTSLKLHFICATYEPISITDYLKTLQDEGSLVYLIVTPPSKKENPKFWDQNRANRNLQRLSSGLGLVYAQMRGFEFALKLRSDTFLGKDEGIQYLIDQVHKFPPQASEVHGRIAVSGQGTVMAIPFHIRDHWYFGYTADLVNFFNLDPAKQWQDGSGIDSTCPPEVALTKVWMKDMGIEAKDTEELLRKYFIVEDAVEMEQVRLTKTYFFSMDYDRYCKEGKSYLQEVYNATDMHGNVVTHADWLTIQDTSKEVAEPPQAPVD